MIEEMEIKKKNDEIEGVKGKQEREYMEGNEEIESFMEKEYNEGRMKNELMLEGKKGIGKEKIEFNMEGNMIYLGERKEDKEKIIEKDF